MPANRSKHAVSSRTWKTKLRGLILFLSLLWPLENCQDSAHAQPNGSEKVAGASPTGPSSQESSTTVVTIDPNQLLINAIHQSVWGPSVSCKVYQRSTAFEQQVIASGEYKAMGAGSGQFRHSTRISAGETTFDRIQVSDGRLMYTQVGLSEPPKRVIIDQVRQSMGMAINHANEQPTISFYLAIGGHSELLRGLYHRYRWYRAVAGKIGGVDVWQIVGRIRTEAPKTMGNTLLDHQNTQVTGLSPELPSEVRLTLGRSASMAYFPYLIEYYQRRKNSNGESAGLELVSIIEHTEPTQLVSIGEREFAYQVQDNIEKIEDDTNLYLPLAPLRSAASAPFK